MCRAPASYSSGTQTPASSGTCSYAGSDSGYGSYSSGSSSASSGGMSKSDASRIQSSQTIGGHYVGAGSFAARAQSAGDRAAKGGRK
jgi:hypothetical protein